MKNNWPRMSVKQCKNFGLWIDGDINLAGMLGVLYKDVMVLLDRYMHKKIGFKYRYYN